MVSAPDAALFPGNARRQELDDCLTRALALAQERVRAGPVTPTLDIDAFNRELTSFDFAAARPLPDLLEWSIGLLEHGVTHQQHPRYFGLFNPAPSFPAQCADRIVSSFNPQLASATTSPGAVALEAHVIRSVAQRAGFPPGAGGHFASGGSEANYTGMLCALTRAHPQFASDGARAFPGQPVFYTSKECHGSWVKIAHQTGIGRSAARLVPTDGRECQSQRSSARSRRILPQAACLSSSSPRRARTTPAWSIPCILVRTSRHATGSGSTSMPRGVVRLWLPNGCAPRSLRSGACGFGDHRCA